MKYEFIKSDTHLADVCKTLHRQEAIGVDLEADAMYCFKDKICLIQIATETEAFLLDPFVLEDLSAFFDVLADPSVVKIFHGADFDVRSLDRDYGARISGLFDTEIACRFLGVKERGLAALLKTYFDVTANKKFQKVDWAQRPLKQEMIEYSVLDVAYLTRLCRLLSSELTGRDRLSWAAEEFEIQEQVRFEHNDTRPLFVRFKGAGRLDNRTLAVLENLLELRIDIAQKKDRPLFKILSNQALMTLACEKPDSVKQMMALGALSQRQAQMYGEQCKEAIIAGLELPHKALPAYPRTRRPRKDPRVMERIKALKKMRESLSQKMGIEPGVLLNNNLITAIAVEAPDSAAHLGEIDMIRKWQVSALGDAILSTVQGL